MQGCREGDRGAAAMVGQSAGGGGASLGGTVGLGATAHGAQLLVQLVVHGEDHCRERKIERKKEKWILILMKKVCVFDDG